MSNPDLAPDLWARLHTPHGAALPALLARGHFATAALIEHRAVAVLIAAMIAPRATIAAFAAYLDELCPHEQPLSPSILAAADWLAQAACPYSDGPFAAPKLPDLAGYLAGEGAAPHIAAALSFAYAAAQNRAAAAVGFHAAAGDLRAISALVLHHSLAALSRPAFPVH